MHNSKKTLAAVQRFDLLLFNEFSNHCLANIVEPLRAANRFSGHARYQWQYYTLDGASVLSSSGLRVSPHGALRDAMGTHLFVMPSYGFRKLATAQVITQLRRSAARYRGMAGLDTGSWLLAQAGLLNGYSATIHWEELTAFAEAFPEVHVLRERFVFDRDRITCSGAMAAFDLAMDLVTRDHGPMLAMEVAQLFMSRDPDQRGGPSLMGKSRTVARALEIMQQNVDEPLPIGRIAREVGCSQKTLENRVKAELQATPQAVYRRLRLIHARKLVQETEQPLSEVASRCGYENASAMTRAFRAEFGMPPREMRAAAL